MRKESPPPNGDGGEEAKWNLFNIGHNFTKRLLLDNTPDAPPTLSQPLHPTCTWGGQHISTTYAWRLQTLLALGCGPQGHPDKEDTLLAQLLRAALYPLVAPNTHSRDFSG